MESSNGEDDSTKFQKQSISDTFTEKMDGQDLDSEAVKTMLKIQMAANAITKSLMNDDGSFNIGKGAEKSQFFSSSISDLAMANMLTCLHLPKKVNMCNNSP